MAKLRKVFINAKYNDPEGKLGNRWKDTKTEIVLTANPNPSTGKWDTTRSSDIDGAGGSDHAKYLWNQVEHNLGLETGGYQDKSMVETVVLLKGFNDFKTGHKGNGIFKFRKQDVPITWEVGVMEYS